MQESIWRLKSHATAALLVLFPGMAAIVTSVLLVRDTRKVITTKNSQSVTAPYKKNMALV
ncbi:MAG: hypothetical protein WBA39_26170 [Rivularia sp. (in: cyanobacteria)]